MEGYIVGYRTWQVWARHGRLFLAAPYAGLLWPPQGHDGAGVYRAICQRARHPAPALDCRCGIYALRVLPDVPRSDSCFVGGGLIIGAVALGGTVIEHQDGWRGETATLLALVPPSCPVCGRPAAYYCYDPYSSILPAFAYCASCVAAAPRDVAPALQGG